MFKGLRVANSSRACSMLRSERARERCRLSVVRYPYAYRDAEDGVGDGPRGLVNRKNARSCAAAGPARGAAARGRRPARGGGAVALGTLASNLSRVGGRALSVRPKVRPSRRRASYF